MTHESFSSTIGPEAFYTAFFDALPTSSLLLQTDSPRFTILAATPQHLQHGGVKKEEIIGKGLFEVYPGDSNDPSETGRDDLQASLTRVLQYKESHRLPMQRYDVADEEGRFVERYWQAEHKPVFSRGGEVAYILQTVEEITDQVKADKKEEVHQELRKAYDTIEKSETALKQFKFMADQAQDPFILMRKNGTFAYLNTKALEAWGYTAEEAAHIRVPDVDPIYNNDVFSAAFTKAQQEELSAFETLHRRKDGHIYPVEVKMGGLMLNDQPHLFAVARDITERKKTEADLRESEARFRNIIEQAPVAITLTRGEELIIESINAPMLQMMNKFSKDEVLGRKMLDVLPELRGQPALQMVLNVLHTGIPFRGDEQPVDLLVNGELKRYYFNFSYTSIEGAVPAVLHVAINVTEQVLARRRIEESEVKLRSILNSAPTAISVFVGPDLIIENANQLMIEVLAAGPDIEGQSFRQLLSGLVEDDQKFLQIIDGVRTTGQPFEAQEVEVFFKAENKTRYFNISFLPLCDEGGAIYAVLDVSVDVTEQVKTRKNVEESETRFRSLIEEAPIPTALFVGQDMVIEVANKPALAVWGKGDSPLGKPLAKALPELEGQPFLKILNEIFTTGETFETKGAPAQFKVNGVMGTYYFDYIFKPLRNAAGEVYAIMDMAVDVTEQVTAHKRVEENEENLHNMVMAAPVGMCVIDAATLVSEIVNESFVEIAGKPYDVIVGNMYWDTFAEARPYYEATLKGVITTGDPYYASEVELMLIRHGKEETVYVTFVYMPMKNGEGAVTKVAIYVLENTPQVEARKRLEESEARFRKLADESPIFVFIIEADPLAPVSYWNKTWLQYTGQTAEEAFGRAWNGIIHPDDIPIVMENYVPAFEAQKSYFIPAVRVKRHDGIYRWHSFKGNPRYLPNGKFSGYVGVGFDIDEQKATEEGLEGMVVKRTGELQRINKELQRSNANLEEFAHAASHDLKEPIRKIHYFTQHLKELLGTQLQEAELRSFARIENASERMGALIDDLLLYSHVSERPHVKEEVDLNEKLQRVLEDLELDVQERKALVHVDALPVVKGYRRQLQQLFQNLISNALKYSRKDVAPQIQITAASVVENERPYHLITVKDNGIGFEQQYGEKIFQMFSRLHGKGEYSGTGVGLSIVKKVVENHDGFIRVESAVGKGSTFKVYLPAQ